MRKGKASPVPESDYHPPWVVAAVLGAVIAFMLWFLLFARANP